MSCYLVKISNPQGALLERHVLSADETQELIDQASTHPRDRSLEVLALYNVLSVTLVHKESLNRLTISLLDELNA